MNKQRYVENFLSLFNTPFMSRNAQISINSNKLYNSYQLDLKLRAGLLYIL